MITIVSIFIAFFLTGVIGNHLIHALQYRNWVSQQKALGLQKEYEALKSLFDEISQLAGKRLARMQRLALSVRAADLDRVEQLRKEYDEALREWNEKLNGLCVRTTFYADYWMTQRLEGELQSKFYEAGRYMEALIRTRREGSSVSPVMWEQLIASLNSTAGALSNFNRDMLRRVKEQQARTYDGETVVFEAHTLERFSTWQLLKALFMPAEKSLSIIRPPSDVS